MAEVIRTTKTCQIKIDNYLYKKDYNKEENARTYYGSASKRTARLEP